MNRSIVVGTVRHGSNVCGKRIRWLPQQLLLTQPSPVTALYVPILVKSQQQRQFAHTPTAIFRRSHTKIITNDSIPTTTTQRLLLRGGPRPTMSTTRSATTTTTTTIDSIFTSTTQRHFHTSFLRAATEDGKTPETNNTVNEPTDAATTTATATSTTTDTNSVIQESPPSAKVESDDVSAISSTNATTVESPPSAKVKSDDVSTISSINVTTTDVPPEVVVTDPPVIETKVETTETPADKTQSSSTTAATGAATTPTSEETKPPVPSDVRPEKGRGKEGKHRDKKQTDDATAKTTSTPTSTNPSSPATTTGDGVRQVDVNAILPSLKGGPPVDKDGVRQYATPEITKDAKFHKAGLDDPTRPEYQNPLHHNNPDADTRFFREDFATEEEFQAAIVPAPPLDHPDGRPSYPQYLHDLADDMVHLNMLEMNELLNRMADHYGFHEGILSPDSAGGEDGNADDDDDNDGSGGGAKVEAEKTTFDVKLVSYDASIKIKIIKEVRVVIPGLGLKEAKELVEGAPVVLQKGVSSEVAEQTKEKLVALGAVIEIA